VLNEVVMRNGAPESPRALEQLVLAADIDAVQRLKDAGYLLFLITNQPDIARGNVTEEYLDAILDRIRVHVPLDDVRFCPHDDADGCECRKPKPGMILDLAHEWRVDMNRSFVIGDMWRDVGAARAAGCRSILIRRDYNIDAQPDVEVTSLTAAVEVVLSDAA
jgi:D-glycero-D-manno-heptose 1,7-bisphosphate phosphatase